MRESRFFARKSQRETRPLSICRNREKDVRREAGLAVPGSSPHTSLDDVIRAREEAFFRELAAEESSGAHPLMHMVASSRKLASIGVPVHQLDPRAALKKSKKAADTSPYEKPLTLVVPYTGRVIAGGLPLPTRKNTQPSGHPREEGSSGDKVSSSANRHRQFLDETLGAVHEQLESTALAEAMLINPQEEQA